MPLPDLIGWSALAFTVGLVLFRTGYRMGREKWVHHSNPQKDSRQQESTCCFRGLNFLLSDEPDKAIEEFIKAVRINSETVEIHLSLGNLYRTRGEVGRAIRIHQNIIARPDLSDINRSTALFALAEDYRQGGFLDRAVAAYRRVLRVNPNHQKALAGLQTLHENEGRWDLALEVLHQLKRISNQADPRREAHLRLRHGLEQQKEAEKSERLTLALPHKTTTKATTKIAIKPFLAAIRVYPGCVEAYRLLGETQLATGNARAAIKSFRAVQKNRPSHFFLLVNALRKAYNLMNDEKGFYKCMTEAVQIPSASARLMVSWSQILEEQNHPQDAIQLLRQGVVQHPGSASLVRQLVLLLGRNHQLPEALAAADRYLDHLTSQQPVFQCAQCGFKSQDISWKCPQCHAWDTMEPL